MYVKKEYYNKKIKQQDDGINQQTKNYEAVKFINWRIAFNGNTTIM